jgi:transposase
MLIPVTLADCIPEDHPVRIFWEIVDGLDWSGWESRYVLVRGQPPIPPKVMAAAILYGLSLGLRSGRRLEWACESVLEIKWLVEGRRIDHSTFCEFRTKFADELKDVFKQTGRVAIGIGMTHLNQVALDGTRVKANSSRHGTASSKILESRLADLDEQIDRMLVEAEEADRRDRDLFGEHVSSRVPRELADVKKRQQLLRQALSAAKQADAKRQTKRSAGADQPQTADDQDRGNHQTRCAKVPVADPDSSILPNKEGGWGPNYSPVVAVAGGMIVDTDVLPDTNEGSTVTPTMDHLLSAFGQSPGQLLADGAFATGSNLSELAKRGIEAVMPVDPAWISPDNPARRADPSVAVPEADWSKLPRTGQKEPKLHRAAFVYDADRDRYYCPMGRELVFKKTTKKSPTIDSIYRVYECRSCEGCPLAAACKSDRVKRRTVSHDEHEPDRQKLAERMKTDEGKALYQKRSHLAETPFAFIKQWIGIRQFLLRGLDKVRTEWLWACTACNLRKLVLAIGKVCAASPAQAG